MVVIGVLLLFWLSVPFAFGGWFTGVLLVIFAFLLRAAAHSLDDTTSSRGR